MPTTGNAQVMELVRGPVKLSTAQRRPVADLQQAAARIRAAESKARPLNPECCPRLRDINLRRVLNKIVAWWLRRGGARTAELATKISADAAFDDLRKRFHDIAVFGTERGPPYRTSKASAIFAYQRCNRTFAAIGHPEFHSHQFRLRFATDLLDEAVDIFEVSRILGHSDLNTTTVYLRMLRGSFNQARALHPRSSRRAA